MKIRPLIPIVSACLVAGAFGCRAERPDRSAPLEHNVDPNVSLPRELPALAPRRVWSEERAELPAPPPRPTAVLTPGQSRLVYRVPGPGRLRLAVPEAAVPAPGPAELSRGGRPVRTLQEVDVRGGEVVVLDRAGGATVAGRRLLPAPLDRTSPYELYLLPPGGVRNEVVRGRLTTPPPPPVDADPPDPTDGPDP